MTCEDLIKDLAKEVRDLRDRVWDKFLEWYIWG